MTTDKITTITDFEHQKLLGEEYNSMKKFDEFLKLPDFTTLSDAKMRTDQIVGLF